LYDPGHNASVPVSVPADCKIVDRFEKKQWDYQDDLYGNNHLSSTANMELDQ
jgi:hypothetical protein